jgi:hypothetical protein
MKGRMKALQYLIVQCRLGQRTANREERKAFVELEIELETRLRALLAACARMKKISVPPLSVRRRRA